MKVSRIIALGLLIPLCGTAVVAVYLNAQERIVPLVGKVVIPKPGAATEPDADAEPDPNVVTRKSAKRATPKPVLDVVPPDPNTPVPTEIGEDQLLPANRPHYPRILPDAESLPLIHQEHAADQQARVLAGQYGQGGTNEKRAEVKKQLREKLVAIFAMQQKRRTAEIAGIEARLARLKEISNKRETNKDAIVDRRLEQMTGGVDELGWEESNRAAAGHPGEVLEQPLYGEPVPHTGNSFDAPSPTRPRYDNVPAVETPRIEPQPRPVLKGT